MILNPLCRKHVVTLLQIVALTSFARSESEIRFAAWNVENLGPTKMARPNVVNVIVSTIQNFDLIVLSEVRDGTGQVPIQLLHAVNSGGLNYQMLVSARYGAVTSSHREQYVYFYNETLLSPNEILDWQNATVEPGSSTLLFPRRSPHAVSWAVSNSRSFETLVIHTSPDFVPEELHALGMVAQEVMTRYPEGRLLIAGDLNADCSYLLQSERRCMRNISCTDVNISLGNPNIYTWLTDDLVDTTTTSSDCAYDRIVVTDNLIPHVDLAVVYRYDTIFNLNDSDTRAVSNHYPVAVTIEGLITTTSSSTTYYPTGGNVFKSTSESSISTAAVIGAVIGGLVLIVLVVLAVLLQCRKLRTEPRGNSESISHNPVHIEMQL